jgi:hypothetical protein
MLALAGGCLVATAEAEASLTWMSHRTEAVEAAKAQGKFVLLLAGRDTCSNCRTMKEIVAESETPPIQTLIRDYFIPWYCNIDNSSEFLDYADGLNPNWVLPLICVIDPAQPGQYLGRSTGLQQAPVFHQRLLQHANVLMVQPRLTGIEPAQGAIGTRVVLQGNNLTNANQVLFHGTAATFIVTPSGALEAEVPTGATTGPITVVTPCGETTSPVEFVVVEGGVIVVHHGALQVTNQSFLAVFHLMVSNQGPSLALDLQLTNALAFGMNLSPAPWPASNLISSLPLSAVASQGTHWLENGVYRWHLGDLAASGQASLTLRYSDVPPGRLNALTTYTVPQGNPAVFNHSALAFVDVPAVPSLAIRRSETNRWLSIQWPGSDPRWTLQSTAGFGLSGPSDWADVMDVPLEIDPEQIAITHLPAAGDRFFRLVFDTTKVPATNTVCPCSCDP